MIHAENPKSHARPAPRLPVCWYDYVAQAWVVNGRYKPCGHPNAMHPMCCFAGEHAGEIADPAHFEQDESR
jgi:hypothetical protein